MEEIISEECAYLCKDRSKDRRIHTVIFTASILHVNKQLVIHQRRDKYVDRQLT